MLEISLLALLYFLLFAGVGPLQAYVGPYLAGELHWSNFRAGSLLSAVYISFAASRIFGGLFIERLSLHRALLFGAS